MCLFGSCGFVDTEICCRRCHLPYSGDDRTHASKGLPNCLPLSGGWYGASPIYVPQLDLQRGISCFQLGQKHIPVWAYLYHLKVILPSSTLPLFFVGCGEDDLEVIGALSAFPGSRLVLLVNYHNAPNMYNPHPSNGPDLKPHSL